MTEFSERARRAFEAGDYARARQILGALVDSGHARAIDLYNLGQVCLAQNDLDGAIAALTRVIDQVPEASYSRALAYERKGQLDAARADYVEALRRVPDDVDVLTDLGTLELTAGSLETALEHLQKAVERDAKANWQYAAVLRELGRRDEARRALERAVAAGEARAHVDLAKLSAREGDSDSAERHFLLAIETDLSLARSDYAYFLLESGEPERAREVAQAAVDSGDGWSFRPLALALQQLGDADGASRQFRSAEAFGDIVDD